MDRRSAWRSSILGVALLGALVTGQPASATTVTSASGTFGLAPERLAGFLTAA